MANPKPTESDLNFEAALAELEDIVRKLESGKTSLEDSVGAYERGMQLRQVCESRLKEAQLKIQKVSAGPDGKAVSVSVDPNTFTEK